MLHWRKASDAHCLSARTAVALLTKAMRRRTAGPTLIWSSWEAARTSQKERGKPLITSARVPRARFSPWAPTANDWPDGLSVTESTE